MKKLIVTKSNEVQIALTPSKGVLLVYAPDLFKNKRFELTFDSFGGVKLTPNERHGCIFRGNKHSDNAYTSFSKKYTRKIGAENFTGHSEDVLAQVSSSGVLSFSLPVFKARKPRVYNKPERDLEPVVLNPLQAQFSAPMKADGLAELKAAIQLVNEAAGNLGAVLVVREGRLGAEIKTII